MKLMLCLFLIFAFLGSIIQSCPPPLNDVRYALNATLLTEVVAEHEANPQLGWANVVGSGSPIDIWPNSDGPKVFVPYCYADDKVKAMIQPLFDAAWLGWFNAIGNAGPKSGHRMSGFREVDVGGEKQYCYIGANWNNKVPPGTLVVTQHSGDGGWSSAGYKPSGWDDSADRHQLALADHLPDTPLPEAVPLIAHEMGHVLGFWHEHQRRDRDHYVHFECKNLHGYDEIKAAADKDPNMTIEKLYKYGFIAPQYSTSAFYEDDDGEHTPDGRERDLPYLVDYSKEYDIHSIMHYNSFFAEKNPVTGVENAPLVKWKNGGPNFIPPKVVTKDNAELISFTWYKGASKGDLEGIKVMYPWQGY